MNRNTEEWFVAQLPKPMQMCLNARKEYSMFPWLVAIKRAHKEELIAQLRLFGIKEDTVIASWYDFLDVNKVLKHMNGGDYGV